MKSSTTRSVPPPIDLSLTGSNMRGTTTTTTTGTTTLAVGINHPYSFRYVVESGLTPPSTSTSATHAFPSASTSALNTPSPSSSFPTSSSSCETPILEWDSSRLVPNRRRRSYSESGYSTSPPTSASSRSCSSNSPTSAGYRSGSNSPFSLRFKQKVKESMIVEEELGVRLQQRVTTGRRSKLWLLAQLPLNAGDTPSRKKVRRLGRSSSSTRLSASFAEGGSGAPGDGGSTWQRPRTSSSTHSGSSSSPSPWRASKLEWQFQWKRLSLLKPSASSLSVATATAATPPPRTPKSAGAGRGWSAAAAAAKKGGQEQCVGREKKKKTDGKGGVPATMARNRSTPNLQVPPDLSLEELGKINAFFAPPPPPALAVHTLSAHVISHHHPTPSPKHIHNRTLNLKPVLPAPKSADASLPRAARGPGPCEYRSIPIALPLSPISSVGGCEEGLPGEIYLTVEDVASGVAMLRYVESPMFRNNN